MKENIVTITDEDGYMRNYVLPIGSSVEEVDLEKCITLEPPPLEYIDWEQVKRDLHNQLVKRNILDLEDIRGDGNFNGAILSALKSPLINLYKELN